MTDPYITAGDTDFMEVSDPKYTQIQKKYATYKPWAWKLIGKEKKCNCKEPGFNILFCIQSSNPSIRKY